MGSQRGLIYLSELVEVHLPLQPQHKHDESCEAAGVESLTLISALLAMPQGDISVPFMCSPVRQLTPAVQEEGDE